MRRVIIYFLFIMILGFYYNDMSDIPLWQRYFPIANVYGAKHELIDNDSQKYNVIKDNLGNNFYNKLDITAKVISIYGDASSFAIAIKKGWVDNINWDKVITDDFERIRVKEMLNDIGILMDVKTIEELKQNHETDN